jgi:hypothetical protein
VSAPPWLSFIDAKAVFQVSDAMYDLRVTQDRIAKEAKSMEQQLLDAFEAGWNAHIDALFDAGRDPDQLAAENARLREALGETDTDLRVLASNIINAAASDPRWEGVASIVQGWVSRNRAALAPATKGNQP